MKALLESGVQEVSAEGEAEEYRSGWLLWVCGLLSGGGGGVCD